MFPTVKQLIQELNTYPQDLPVMVSPTSKVSSPEILVEIREVRKARTRLEVVPSAEYASQDETMDSYATMDIDEVIVIVTG